MTADGPSGLESVMADGLAELANAGLGLDPASRARLAALEGCGVQITARLAPPFGQRHLGITVHAGRLRLFPHTLATPDAVVAGAPADLGAWLFREGGTAADLEVDGDPAVAERFAAVCRGFRPDLAAPLEGLLGRDGVATALGGAELALATLRSAFQGAEQAAREGAGEAFANRRRAAQFAAELEDLRARLHRLDDRVAAEERRRVSP